MWRVSLKWKWEVQFQPLESDIMCLTKFKVTWGVSLKWKWEVPAWISMQRLHPHSSGGSTILGPVYSLKWFPHFFSFFIGIFGHKLKSYHFQRYQLHFIRTSSQGMTFARNGTLDPESYPSNAIFWLQKRNFAGPFNNSFDDIFLINMGWIGSLLLIFWESFHRVSANRPQYPLFEQLNAFNQRNICMIFSQFHQYFTSHIAPFMVAFFQ